MARGRQLASWVGPLLLAALAGCGWDASPQTAPPAAVARRPIEPARQLLSRLRSQGASPLNAAHELLHHAETCWRAGERAEGGKALDLAALQIAELADEVSPEVLVDLRCAIAPVLQQFERSDDARAMIDRAYQAAQEIESPQAGTLVRLALADHRVEGRGHALTSLARAEQTALEVEDVFARLGSLDQVARGFQTVGRPEDAVRIAMHMEAMPLLSDTYTDKSRGLSLLASTQVAIGLRGQARATFRQAESVARQIQDPVKMVFTLADVAGMMLRSRFPSEGRALYEECQAKAKSLRTRHPELKIFDEPIFCGLK